MEQIPPHFDILTVCPGLKIRTGKKFDVSGKIMENKVGKI